MTETCSRHESSESYPFSSLATWQNVLFSSVFLLDISLELLLLCFISSPLHDVHRMRCYSAQVTRRQTTRAIAFCPCKNAVIPASFLRYFGSAYSGGEDRPTDEAVLRWRCGPVRFPTHVCKQTLPGPVLGFQHVGWSVSGHGRLRFLRLPDGLLCRKKEGMTAKT